MVVGGSNCRLKGIFGRAVPGTTKPIAMRRTYDGEVRGRSLVWETGKYGDGDRSSPGHVKRVNAIGGEKQESYPPSQRWHGMKSQLHE